jgi:hypothetical protein
MRDLDWSNAQEILDCLFNPQPVTEQEAAVLKRFFEEQVKWAYRHPGDKSIDPQALALSRSLALLPEFPAVARIALKLAMREFVYNQLRNR